jgi:hypothetical protein
MAPEIKKSLDQAAVSFKSIAVRLEDKTVGNNERQTLLIGYFDVCMEHIQSIHVLTRVKLFGSAFALLRPFSETCYRALWMLKFATDTEVGGIATGTFTFPNMGEKIKKLDTIYTGTDFFKKLKDSWSAMCDYTHTGNLQLSRRWSGDELEPSYRDSEVIEVIKGSEIILLMFAYVVLKEHNYMDEAEAINSRIIKITN